MKIKKEDIVNLFDMSFLYFFVVLFLVMVALLLGSSILLWEIKATENIQLASIASKMVFAHEALVLLSGVCIVYFVARYVYSRLIKKRVVEEDERV